MQALTIIEFFTRLAVGAIRALIVNNTSGTGIILRGIDATRTADGSDTRLTARLLLAGDAATRLEQLVSRLSLEPGIHVVHWHAADSPGGGAGIRAGASRIRSRRLSRPGSPGPAGSCPAAGAEADGRGPRRMRAYHVVLIRPIVAGGRGYGRMTRAWGHARPPGGAGHLDAVLAGRLADTMFALSTPSRVLILGCLLAGPRSVTEITETLGMEQSAVSHQLRVLREHHLVRAERAGRMRLYALYDEHVSVLLEAGLRHVDAGRAGPSAGGPASGEEAGGAS